MLSVKILIEFYVITNGDSKNKFEVTFITTTIFTDTIF